MRKAILNGITAFLITLGVILGIGTGLWVLKTVSDESGAYNSLKAARLITPAGIVDYANNLDY